MKNKQETISQAIPSKYCILQLTLFEGKITSIGITKVICNCPRGLYIVDTMIESLDQVLPRILQIMGDDTTYYINKETEIELLKKECEKRQIPINNKLINSQIVLDDIGKAQRDFVCNYLELKVKM